MSQILTAVQNHPCRAVSVALSLVGVVLTVLAVAAPHWTHASITFRPSSTELPLDVLITHGLWRMRYITCNVNNETGNPTTCDTVFVSYDDCGTSNPYCYHSRSPVASIVLMAIAAGLAAIATIVSWKLPRVYFGVIAVCLILEIAGIGNFQAIRNGYVPGFRISLQSPTRIRWGYSYVFAVIGTILQGVAMAMRFYAYKTSEDQVIMRPESAVATGKHVEMRPRDELGVTVPA